MISTEGPKGGKRSSDFDINLVPFIDLMSTCICFLLITAVWTQVSMIQIGSSIYGKKNDTGQIDQPEKEKVMLKIDVNDQGYSIKLGPQALRIPKNGGEYDQGALVAQLRDIKQKYQDKTDAIVSLLDNIKYDELIKTMDSLLIAGFPEIAIATQGAN
jgi:biopolymer transport protein ExbD